MRGGKLDFDAFVKRQQPAQERPVDWGKERDEYLGKLEELYHLVQTHLQKYIQSGEISRSYRDTTLVEENIGSYVARQLVLKIGRKEVTFKPIGTLLIGTKGRVDVVGSAGQMRLAMVDRDATGPRVRVTVTVGPAKDTPKKEEPKEVHWIWKIITNPPDVRYVELTPENIFEALMEVSGG